MRVEDLDFITPELRTYTHQLVNIRADQEKRCHTCGRMHDCICGPDCECENTSIELIKPLPSVERTERSMHQLLPALGFGGDHDDN